MKFWMLLMMCVPLIAGCTKTETVPNMNQPTENASLNESSARIQNAKNAENIEDTNNPIESEPQVTGRLSSDIKDIEGKKLTRCEYRYLHKNGDFVSVVAEINGDTNIFVTERSSENSNVNTYKKAEYSSPNAKQLEGYLHKLDTYGKVPGPLMWLDAPERDNWGNDDSTTWIIMNYEDVQLIVSSRQVLPESRYKAFYTIYSYMTSFVPNYHRKLRQNIGEPAKPIVKTVHGQKVRLVPGTGNTVLDGAEIDYGNKKWWIEEEFVGKFESNSKDLSENESGDVNGKSTMNIGKDGNFTFTLGSEVFIGSLSNDRLYRVEARGWMVLKTSDSEAYLKENGRIEQGQKFSMDYSDDDSDKQYSRIRIKIDGEPYVDGRGYKPSKTVYLHRK